MTNNFSNFANAEASGEETSRRMEHLNNMSRDISDNSSDAAKKFVDEVPKTAEEFVDSKGFGAPRSSQKYKEKQNKNKKAKEKKRLELDFAEYEKFVKGTTSDCSASFEALIARYKQLKQEGCDIHRLDTAASGMSAEAGEFMEIVKKMKFQGKPWDDANKEHLIKELGDVMWYVMQASIALGVDIETVIYTNTLKLASRYSKEKFTVQESENRKEGDI